MYLMPHLPDRLHGLAGNGQEGRAGGRKGADLTDLLFGVCFQ